MAPPERRIVVAGESPVRVSAGAPGSRLQPGGEIHPSRAECRKPLKERGANRRAATISERSSLVRLSAARCLGGPSQQAGYIWLPTNTPLANSAGWTTGDQAEGLDQRTALRNGPHRLQGTVLYPTQATPRRSSLSCVRENCTHSLKGGYMETGQPSC
jgi:hypothetical protein